MTVEFEGNCRISSLCVLGNPSTLVSERSQISHPFNPSTEIPTQQNTGVLGRKLWQGSMGVGLVSQGGWSASAMPSIEGWVNSITGSQAAPLLLLLGGIIGLLVSTFPISRRYILRRSRGCRATQARSKEQTSALPLHCPRPGLHLNHLFMKEYKRDIVGRVCSDCQR